jgi:hypothetical protein
MHAGVGVDQAAVFEAQAIDVVAMKVAQHHIIDVFGLEARCGQVAQQFARGGRAVVGKTGVKQVALVAIDQQERGERDIDVIGGQILCGQQRLDLVERHSGHKFLPQRAAQGPIVQGNDFHGAKLHALESHRRQFGRAELGGVLRPNGRKGQRGSTGNACTQKMTAVEHLGVS